ncbi:hypothetical protein ACP4OV_014294 [Aristida adscensionis]
MHCNSTSLLLDTQQPAQWRPIVSSCSRSLYFFLLLLQAQARDNNIGVNVVIKGEARCKINPSMVIRNASLDLVIGSTRIPGAGRTTDTGRIVLTANLTSAEQLDAMLRNSTGEAFVVAPPHACGAPQLPAGTVVAAPVQLTAVIRGKTGGSGDTTINGQPAIAGILGGVGDFACSLLGVLFGDIGVIG